MRTILIAVIILLGFSAAAGVGTTQYRDLSVVYWCAALALVIQWLAYVPAYLLRTEKFYDLCGSLTFIIVTLLALALTGRSDPHALLLAGMVLTWALRLGSFLFTRVLREGGDRRFVKVKTQPIAFLSFWTLQGLWVVMCAGPVLAAISAPVVDSLPLWALIGGAVWLVGFIFETIADRQKQRFRAEHGRTRFIDSGLWSISRHPNYAGEIILWSGIALCALPALHGWQYLTLISPIFVWVLLTRISGIPLLEAMADRTWADNEAYLTYKQRTPLLWPRWQSTSKQR